MYCVHIVNNQVQEFKTLHSALVELKHLRDQNITAYISHQSGSRFEKYTIINDEVIFFSQHLLNVDDLVADWLSHHPELENHTETIMDLVDLITLKFPPSTQTIKYKYTDLVQSLTRFKRQKSEGY